MPEKQVPSGAWHPPDPPSPNRLGSGGLGCGASQAGAGFGVLFAGLEISPAGKARAQPGGESPAPPAIHGSDTR